MAPHVWFSAMEHAQRISRRYGRRTLVYGVQISGQWTYYVGWARPRG